MHLTGSSPIIYKSVPCGGIKTPSKMKNLLVLFVLIVSANMVSAQSTFYGLASEKSIIHVQNLSSGKEYAFETRDEIVIPIHEEHAYLIMVYTKSYVKQFIIRGISPNTLDDQLYDLSACEGTTIITSNYNFIDKEFSAGENTLSASVSSLRE